MTEKNDGRKASGSASNVGQTLAEGLQVKPSTEEIKSSGLEVGVGRGPAKPNPSGTKAGNKSNGAKKRGSKKAPENTECQNCGARLQGDYCHQCGQAAKEPRRLVIGLVQDVFVETLAIDGKLARSIGLLLWRPGLLARRFLEGKRVRYSPPFRLYLFASVFFFFAVFWMLEVPESLAIDDTINADPEEIAAAREGLDDAKQEMAASLGDVAPAVIADAIDELDASLAQVQNEPPGKAPPADAQSGETEINEGADTPAGETDAGETRRSFKEMEWEDFDYSGPDWLEPHVKQLLESGKRVVDDPRLFYAEMRANLPRFLLLAPVIYGLTLTLLYIYRRKFFVYDHFIVSLYMHAAIYAYLLTALLISRVPVVGSWLWFAPVGWGLLQPLLVLRQAYGSNWFSVWIKWFVSTSIYVMALAVIILLGLSFSLYQS